MWYQIFLDPVKYRIWIWYRMTGSKLSVIRPDTFVMLPVLCWITLTGIFWHLTRITVKSFDKLTGIIIFSELCSYAVPDFMVQDRNDGTNTLIEHREFVLFCQNSVSYAVRKFYGVRTEWRLKYSRTLFTKPVIERNFWKIFSFSIRISVKSSVGKNFR